LLEENARNRRRLERYLSSEHFIRDDPKGVDVARRVDLAISRRLLRAHVRGCADGDPGAGQRPAPDVRQGLGDPEVGHHHPASGALEQDVVGLDVAMDHAHRMGESKRVRCLLHDAPGLFHRQPLSPAQPSGQGFAVDESHDEVDESLLLTNGVDRDDVGM
jgi:hypothetical protein